jgi:hypothetical protein
MSAMGGERTVRLGRKSGTAQGTETPENFRICAVTRDPQKRQIPELSSSCNEWRASRARVTRVPHKCSPIDRRRSLGPFQACRRAVPSRAVAGVA